VVTAVDREAAEALATELAEAAWARRDQFYPKLTPLDEAVRLAVGTADPSRAALIFADVADNPGGGGRGNTMYILEAFAEAGVRDAIVGLIYDAPLANEAHSLGDGATFEARFNRQPESDFSKPFAARATVRRLHPGPIR